MKIDYRCLPCLVNQNVRVAEMVDAPHREELFHKLFAYLAQLDFDQTNPEVLGTTFRMLKQHLGNADPYRETRRHYNQIFMEKSAEFERKIAQAPHPFYQAIRYSIIGNLIDFNPVHNTSLDSIDTHFAQLEQRPLAIDHSDRLARDLASGHTLLYLGDNCGEICLDRLLIGQIRSAYPQLTIYFGVRGEPVVNDSIAEDAHMVGIDAYATIISNGDDSLGTVLARTSPQFQQVFSAADVVISKGQANYESLSEEQGKNIYFLLMSKCQVIAEHVGVPVGSMVCMQAGGAGGI